MNLIEQLGGYEKAKAIVTQNIKDFEEAVDEVGIYHPSSGWIVHEDLVKELLEYRRQHNIFEVGDIAVNSRGDESRLLKIWRVDMCAHNSKMSIADYDAESLGGWSRFHALRHATDEEIKAGKRLEVS